MSLVSILTAVDCVCDVSFRSPLVFLRVAFSGAGSVVLLSVMNLTDISIKYVYGKKCSVFTP